MGKGKRLRGNNEPRESRSLVEVALACGHTERIRINDVSRVATVVPPKPRTRWQRLTFRGRKRPPMIASEGLFVRCGACRTEQPILR